MFPYLCSPEALTDSFTYEIECEEDIYNVMAGRSDYLDFSNYPPEHPNYNADNYLEPGYWKVGAFSFVLQS